MELKILNLEECKAINGGHEGTSYGIGVFVGNVLEVAITVSGIGKVGKFIKAIF